MAASSRSKQDDPHGLHKNLTDQTATECCIIFTALTRLLPHCRWTCSRQQQVWGVIHIKPMSKIVHGACIKPDVAATLQVEMQLPAAGWGVMNITSAGLKAWSFTDTVTFAAQPCYPKVRAVTVWYPIR